MITWRKVESSNIAAVGWEKMRLDPSADPSPTFDVCYVEFTSGSIYGYIGVPRQRVVAMSQAESVGQYFNKHIKGRFESHHIEVPI